MSERPTREEIIEHYKTGIGEDCLVCEKPLYGHWTDYNGQLECGRCGMTYQILGCHLKDEMLAENNLTPKDIAQRYCDCYVVLPLYKAYWEATGYIIPAGLYMGMGPRTAEDYRRLYKWLVDNAEEIEPVYGDVFNFDGMRADEAVMRTIVHVRRKDNEISVCDTHG